MRHTFENTTTSNKSVYTIGYTPKGKKGHIVSDNGHTSLCGLIVPKQNDYYYALNRPDLCGTCNKIHTSNVP